MRFGLPPLNITLKQNLGIIRGGLVVQFPRPFAEALIRRRLAVVVGDALVTPDVLVSEEDLPFTKSDIDPVFVAAGRIIAPELR